MLFEKKEDQIKVVERCPVTKASSGVLEMSPELAAKIAGAVTDGIEWMVLLIGERSADGFEVKVTDVRVPKQRRSSGDVQMAEPMDGDGSTIGPEVVGVLHSHHRMGAFFSKTDDDELNPHFWSSIVVAQGETTALGFKYKAEGKVILPCGSLGKVPFFLRVTGSEKWAAEVVHEYDGNSGLGDCEHITETTIETENGFTDRKETPEACGLHVEKFREKPLVFGRAGGEALLTEVRQQTVSYSYRSDDDRCFGNDGRGYHRQDTFGNGHLSRKERKALKRRGKYSARRDGLVDCSTEFSEGRYVTDDEPTFEKLPHEEASVVRMNSDDTCDSCRNLDTRRESLYLLINEFGTPPQTERMWMCADCYDWWTEWREDEEDDYDYTIPVAKPQPTLTHPFEVGKVGSSCLGRKEDGTTCLKGRWSAYHRGHVPICTYTKTVRADCSCGKCADIYADDTVGEELEKGGPITVTSPKCAHSPAGLCEACARVAAEKLGMTSVLLPSRSEAVN